MVPVTDRFSDVSGRPLGLDLLRTFLAVHRAGSLTAAARGLGLSQPTVTAQIASLERRLGRPLFERLPHGVAPTAAASALAARIAGPLDELAAVADPAAGAGLEGPVQLAGPAELIAVRALPDLAPLVADGVRLRISTGLADDLLDGLRAGRYDLVVSALRPRGRAVRAEPLADEEFVLVAAPDWARRIGPVQAERSAGLDDLPLVSYADDLPILRRYWRHVFRRRLTAEPAVVVPDLRAVLAAVRAGAGVTVLPRYLCAADLADGRVVALLEPADPPINTAFLVHRAGAPLRRRVTQVRDVLLRAGRHW
jgi:DNA-binding transcriptional LysR family regulator